MSEVGALNESGAVDCVTPLVPSRFSIKRPASEPLVSQSKCQLIDSSIQPDTTTPVKQPTASLFSDGQLQTTGVQYIIFLVDWSSFIPFFSFVCQVLVLLLPPYRHPSNNKVILNILILQPFFC